MNRALHLSIRPQLGPMTVERLVPPQTLEIHFTSEISKKRLLSNRYFPKKKVLSLKAIIKFWKTILYSILFHETISIWMRIWVRVSGRASSLM